MAELRKDPLLDRWVLIAPERAQRPRSLAAATVVENAVDPFAAGREDRTPPELFAVRDAGSQPNDSNWRVRVVPNRYPAISSSTDVVESDDFFRRAVAHGSHEVVVECPHDEPNLSRLSIEQIADVLTAWRARLRELGRDERIAHAIVFRNQAAAAGASVAHSHSQIVALPIVTTHVAEMLRRCEAHRRACGRDYFAELIERERSAGSRVVSDRDGFVAMCPFASRFQYEVCIAPQINASHFEDETSERLSDFAGVLKDVLVRMEQRLNDPPFNLVLHTAPFRTGPQDAFRWHVELLPRLDGLAGFELGGGCWMNPVPPEEAARVLQ